jgi:hypothetical protein
MDVHTWTVLGDDTINELSLDRIDDQVRRPRDSVSVRKNNYARHIYNE